MKIKKLSITLFVLFMAINCFAQCREMNVSDLTETLNNLVKPTMSIKLDRDDSRFTILGYTERFSLPAENISKPARDWRYHVEDIKSDDSNLWFDKKQKNFVLDVRFEGDGPEIKGICPGCLKRFRDRRAPDVNWIKSRIARLRFNPIVYNNGITLEIIDVELFGEFDVNGPLESFFPRMIRKIEDRIKKYVQTEARKSLSNTNIKRQIAARTQPLVTALGLRSVRSIRFSSDGSKIQFCQ